MIFVIGYLLVGLVVGVLVARSMIRSGEPTDPVEKFACGFMGLAAMLLWFVIVPAMGIYAIARRLR